MQAHAARRRANAHGHDLNKLLSVARTWRHDGVSVKSLQRNYGRSIGARAPGRFMSELERKAERAGGKSLVQNARQLKTSEFDHSSAACVKKSLSERWHVFGEGRGRVQRDVYSAFLALHAVPSFEDTGAPGWRHDTVVLERAWQALAPALAREGVVCRIRQHRDGQGGQHPLPRSSWRPVLSYKRQRRGPAASGRSRPWSRSPQCQHCAFSLSRPLEAGALKGTWNPRLLPRKRRDLYGARAGRMSEPRK